MDALKQMKMKLDFAIDAKTGLEESFAKEMQLRLDTAGIFLHRLSKL